MRSELFVRKKQVRIVLVLRRNREPMYKGEINDQVDTTYSNLVDTVADMKEEGFIEDAENLSKNDRKSFVRLTEKGEELADYLQGVVNAMELNW